MICKSGCRIKEQFMAHSVRWVFLLAVVVFTVSIAPAAWTQETAPESYSKGIQAFEESDYVRARDYFREAVEENALYRESTGRSGWSYLGLSLEAQEDPYGAIDAMVEGLDTLTTAGLDDWYLNYDLSRLIAVHQKSEFDSLITPLMVRTFQNVSAQDQPDLWQRLRSEMDFLLNAEERAELKALSGDPTATGGIFYRFFRREDPNPITPENEFFPLFFRRLHEARKEYTSYKSERGFDDRGAIYVRLGNPWKVHYDRMGIMGPEGHITYPYEIWFYRSIHPDVYFTFVQRRGRGDYELVDGPESIFYPFYQSNYNLRYFVGEVHLGLYFDLAPLHPVFLQRLHRLQEQYSVAEAASYAKMHFGSEDKFHFAGLDTLTRRIHFHEQTEILSMNLRMLRFMEPDGRIRTETTYAIPNEELFFDDRSGQPTTSLRGEIGIFDTTYQLIFHEPINTSWAGTDVRSGREGVFIGQWNTHLDPGAYNIYFRIENPEGKKETVVNSDFVLDAFPESELSMSNIRLARSIEIENGDTPFHRNGLFIKPLVEYMIPLEQKLFIYFEVYNLSRDPSGNTRYRMTMTLDQEERKRGFLGIGGKIQTVTVFEMTETMTGTAPREVIYRPIVFEAIPEGSSTFRITVTDLIAEKETTESEPVEIVE